jgi:hypothetical protein
MSQKGLNWFKFQKKKKNLGDSLLCIVQREINFPIHSIKHEKGKWYPMPG